VRSNLSEIGSEGGMSNRKRGSGGGAQKTVLGFTKREKEKTAGEL